MTRASSLPKAAILALLILALALVNPPAARAQSLSAEPQQGPGGTSVTVSGSGFPVAEDLDVYWDEGAPIIEVTADASGSFAAKLTVPGTASQGTHSIQVARALTSTVI